MNAPLKRYALFRWDRYYPCGGFHDLVGTYDSVIEALAGALTATKELKIDSWDQNYELIDLRDGTEVGLNYDTVERIAL